MGIRAETPSAHEAEIEVKRYALVQRKKKIKIRRVLVRKIHA